MVEPDRPQMTIKQGSCFACCITRATDTLRRYYTYCSSTAKMVRRTHPKFGYTYISAPVLCVLYLITVSNLSCLSESDWCSLLFFGFCPSSKFKKKRFGSKLCFLLQVKKQLN